MIFKYPFQTGFLYGWIAAVLAFEIILLLIRRTP